MFEADFYTILGGIIISASVLVFVIIRLALCYFGRNTMPEIKDNNDTKKQKFIVAICLTILFTFVLTIPITVLTTKFIFDQNMKEFTAPSLPNNTRTVTEKLYMVPPPSVNNSISPKLHFVPRNEWVAQPPVHATVNLKHPVPYIIILHTATDNCTDNIKCIKIVRQVQNFHIENNGWWDIAYNFLVGGNGYVYEGRGWLKQGANALGWNNRSIGIAFIGTFTNVVPPEKQIVAFQQLMQEGINKGYLNKDYKLFAQRQLSDTPSPGKAFFEVIKKWRHWTEKPDNENK